MGDPSVSHEVFTGSLILASVLVGSYSRVFFTLASCFEAQEFVHIAKEVSVVFTRLLLRGLPGNRISKRSLRVLRCVLVLTASLETVQTLSPRARMLS